MAIFSLQLKKFLSQVKKIKDDVEYYMDEHQDPDFEENEFLYEDIEGLDEVIQLDDTVGVIGGLPSSLDKEDVDATPTSNISGNNSPVSPPIHSSDSNNSDPDKRRKSSDDSSKVRF